jgi:hypothetical protein
MKRRLFLAQSAGFGLAATLSPPAVRGAAASHGESRNALIDGMSRVRALGLGYPNFRYSKSERTGSRVVDLSLASRNAGLL